MKPGRVGGHQDGGDFLLDAAVRAFLLAGDRGDGDQPGDVGAGVGDELLVAVDDPLPAAELGGGLGAAGVGAGFRLGQAEAGERLAGGQQRQPFLLLGLVAEAVDRHGAEGDAGLQGDGDGLVHAAQLFEGEGQGEVVAAHAAEFLREGQAEEAHVRHLGDHLVGEAVLLVVLGGDRGHHFVGEFADGVAEVLVFLAEFKIRHGDSFVCGAVCAAVWELWSGAGAIPPRPWR